MRRTLIGLVAGAVLLVPAHVAAAPGTSTASASVSASASASVGAEVAAPRVVERDVRLGHKPVRLTASRAPEAIRLTFRGRRGQLVELARWSPDDDWLGPQCVQRRLWSEGKRLPAWGPGYWRLPRTTTYTAVLEPCSRMMPDTTMQVQVRTAVVRDAVVDGPVVAAGSDHDRSHLVRVDLRQGVRLGVDVDLREPRHLLLPNGSASGPLSYGRIYLETGTRPGWGGRRSTAGAHYVAVHPGTSVRVTSAATYDASVDGAGLTLADGGVTGREHVVAFTGRAGQWIYPELLRRTGEMVTDGAATARVLGPGGERLGSHLLTQCPGKPTPLGCDQYVAGPWQLPADGTYRMSLRVASSALDEGVTLRLRAATTGSPLVLDGPATTYTSTSPGQWVVAPYTEGVGHLSAVRAANASTSLTDWRITLASGFPQQCHPYNTSNGCGDYWLSSVTPAKPEATAPSDGNAGPSMMLLAVPPGVQGSIEVRLFTR